MKYHRHLTHSLLLAPLMALLPPLIVRLASRKPIAWKMAYLISLVGVMSHLALDLTNVYGIRLLLPFSARWLRLDIVSVVDPWIWAALLIALAAPALARLVESEIGAPRRSGRTAAMLALAFLPIYEGARAALHERALAILDSRIYDDSPPRGVAAFPSAVSPFAWRGLVIGASSYTLFDMNIREPFDPAAGVVFHQAPDSLAIERAARTEAFQALLGFAQYPIWTETPLSDPPGGVRVQLSDLRFGTPRQPGFTATAILDAQGQVVQSYFSFLRPQPR